MPVSMTAMDKSQQTASDAAYPNNTLLAGAMTLVFTVRHKTSKTVLKEHRLLCMPTSFQMDTEGRSQVYYTREGLYVDMLPRNAIGMTFFTISGHTLYRGIGGSRSTTEGTSTTMIDGAAAIKDLQDTIRLYFFPGNDGNDATTDTTETNPGDLQLEFLNLHAPRSAEDSVGLMGWIIHPHRGLVSVRQDASKPFLWQYQFAFAGIQRLTEEGVSDSFAREYSNMDSLSTSVLDRLDNVTEQSETITDAFTDTATHMQEQVQTFVQEVRELSSSVRDYISGITETIEYPLYAAHAVREAISGVIALPSFSVQSLGGAAQHYQRHLEDLITGASLSRAFAGTSLVPLVTLYDDDPPTYSLRLSVNGEPAQTFAFESMEGGEVIARTIQERLRSATPTYRGNVNAYRDAKVTYQADEQRYRLQSGTYGSESASLSVMSSGEANDAAVILGLGADNGGTETQGSSAPLAAMDLLRQVQFACQRLEAFPEYFADSLSQETTRLQALQQAMLPQEAVRGEQHLTYVLLSPGDSLQSLAARAGVPWETVALANHLQYPYVMDGPATMLQGRVTTPGQLQALTDTTQHWFLQQWQGQRVDLIRNDGAGQSRQIVANDQSTLYLDRPWTVLPTALTHYAIRLADNPFIATGTATAGGATTLTDSTLALVPESQRGYELRLLAGPGAGQRRRIVEHTPTVYVVDRPWDSPPGAGTVYAIVTPQAPVRRHVLLLGDQVAIPRPTRVPRPHQVRSILHDTATITGQALRQEDKLFGMDLLLTQGDLTLDVARQDLATVAGLKNVRQAVLNSLNLRLGELEYAPGLGSYLHEHLGRIATLPGEKELLHSVERTIRADPRIARMGPTSVRTHGGSVEVAFSAVTISGESVERIAIR